MQEVSELVQIASLAVGVFWSSAHAVKSLVGCSDIIGRVVGSVSMPSIKRCNISS